MGGGGTPQAPQAPTPPPAPTATQTAADYAAALPTYYEAALKYQPQIAALEKQINEQLYPQTAGLQETIAGQTATGLNAPIPDWYKSQVQDTLSSRLGRNLVYNPQAQESYGLATHQAYKEYGDYYRNLALSATGRQPLATSTNMLQSYTPAAQMGYAQQGYGTQANIYGTQSSNWQNPPQNPWMNVAGSLAGGIGSGLGTGMGMYAAKKWF